MGLFQRFKDATRRQKATVVKQELANRLFVNPLCTDYENVFAQVQPLINEMKTVVPFGVGRNNGRLPMARTPELAVLYSPNEAQGYVDFVQTMFATWLTEDELNIHVHLDRGKVIGYTILPKGCKTRLGNGHKQFQIRTEAGLSTVNEDEVMTLVYSRSPSDLDKGVSPASAVRAWAQTEDLLAQYERAYIENGAIPASITFIRASTREKFEEVRKELEHNLRGASNHGKTIYAWRQFNTDTNESLDQVEVKTIQGNNSTLAIKELADVINDHLNKAFGVSNFILGDDSSAKYDNAELSDRQFLKRRVYPALELFWSEFQHELDRITGGLGYAIQFELELPELTERTRAEADIKAVQAQTLTSLIQAGAQPLAAVKALGLPKEWQAVAVGVSNRALVAEKQTSAQSINSLTLTSGAGSPQKLTSLKGEPSRADTSAEPVEKHVEKSVENPVEKSTGGQGEEATKEPAESQTDKPTGTPMDEPAERQTDKLPPMDREERKIYRILLAMAERIFASEPNVDANGVIDEITAVLEGKAQLGGVDGVSALAKALKNPDTVAKLKAELQNVQITEGLRERIRERVRALVGEYGEQSRGILEEVLQAKQGASAGEITKALSEAMPRYNAERIARTETTYAFKSGRLDEDQRIAEKYGLKVKLKWRARHDAATCPVCRAMDGETVSIGEAFTHLKETSDGRVAWTPSKWNDFGKIPAPHPNCRCNFDEIVEEEE